SVDDHGRQADTGHRHIEGLGRGLDPDHLDGVSSPLSCPYGLVLDIQVVQSVEYSERGIPRFVLEQTRALQAFPNLLRGIFLNPRRPFPGDLPSDLLASPLLTWNSASAFTRARGDGPIAYYMMWPLEGEPGPAFLPQHAMR